MKTFEEKLKTALNNYLDTNFDEDLEIYDYIRGDISAEDKRHALKEVERVISEIAYHAGRYCNSEILFNEKETYDLEYLFSLRSMILDEMMLHTHEELQRFKYQNDRLLRLTERANRQERDIILMFYHTPNRKQDTMAYDLKKKLTFEWDVDAVIKMSDDEYYGSNFSYMLYLISEFLERTHCRRNLINEPCVLLDEGKEKALKDNADTMDNGASWAEGIYLNHESFKDICVCYAVHAVCTHLPYSIPDLLRMDDFHVGVALEYGYEDFGQSEE